MAESSCKFQSDTVLLSLLYDVLRFFDLLEFLAFLVTTCCSQDGVARSGGIDRSLALQC